MNRYIEADKLLDIIIKMRKEYATQEVAEDHKGLKAVLGGQCLVLTKIIEIIDSLQQEQPEVELEDNGWIDCRKQMPKETKQWSDTLQGHREWTESDLVLAWDSMYGCIVDATKNGKWMSEERGGCAGQVVHGIIAWRPIPEFNEELLFNAKKKK